MTSWAPRFSWLLLAATLLCVFNSTAMAAIDPAYTDNIDNPDGHFASGPPASSSATTSSSPAADAPPCDALPRVKVENDKAIADHIMRGNTAVMKTVGALQAERAYACIDPIIKLIQKVYKSSEALKAGFYPAIATFIAVAAANILAALLNQLFDQVVNAVCNVSDQVFNYLKSGLENAICLPSGKGLNPFDFKIDLKAVQCSGWSIDLLNGGIKGNIIQGLDVNLNNLGQQAAQSVAQQKAIQAQQQTDLLNKCGPDLEGCDNAGNSIIQSKQQTEMLKKCGPDLEGCDEYGNPKSSVGSSSSGTSSRDKYPELFGGPNIYGDPLGSSAPPAKVGP